MSPPPADPVALARDLLRCPSVTPAEGGALALLEGVLKGAGFAVHRVTFAEPGTAPVENLFARIGSEKPHICFAGHTDVVPPGDAATLEPPAVRRRHRRRHPLRPRRRRHEGRGRLRGGRQPRSSGRARRPAEGLDLVPDHRRRGEHRRQRHHQAPAMGGRARRALRPLHPRRAEQCLLDRRHHQGRPARLAQRHAGDHRQAGPRRLSAARRQPGARAGRPDGRADGGAARPWQREFRCVEPRIHLDRYRQRHGQPHSRRGTGALQHPFQRLPQPDLADGR